MDAFVGALDDAGVRLVALNFAAGDLAAGDRGLLSLPAGSAAFRDNIDACVGIAARTGCGVLNALYGNRADGLPERQQDELATENLSLAAGAAARAGATVVVEALNSLDTPRAAIVSSQRALALIRAVRATGAASIAFLADLYHLSRMGEDPDRYAGPIRWRHRARPGRRRPRPRRPGDGPAGLRGAVPPARRPGLPGLDRL